MVAVHSFHLSSINCEGDWGVGLTLSYARDDKMLSIVFSEFNPFDLFAPESTFFDTTRNWTLYWGVAYGIILSGDKSPFHAVSLGLSYVFNKSYDHPETSFQTIGIPVEWEYHFAPACLFSTGMRAYVNLNIKKPFCGIGLSLIFGKAR